MSVREARERLKAGDVVAIPTETVYGLAGDIERPQGLKKIFAVKERPFFDPLIVHVDTTEKARALTTQWTEIHEALAQHCWPGPLTLIAPKIPTLDPLITSGLMEVGLRCPRHPLTLELLQDFAGLAAPSANKFGRTSPTRAEHVHSEFGNQVYVLDGGPCEVGIESTVAAVVRTDNRWKLLVYRPGFYTAAHLHDILEEKGLPTETSYTESPVAPGQLEHHYMPPIPVLLAEKLTRPELIEAAEKKMGRKFQQIAHLQLEDDPALAARLFYENLRTLSPGHDAILVSVSAEMRQSEAWRALLNRLGKAASFKA